MKRKWLLLFIIFLLRGEGSNSNSTPTSHVGAGLLSSPEQIRDESVLMVGVARTKITPVVETFTDQNKNSQYDLGEPFEDLNQNGKWDPVWLAGFSPGRSSLGMHDDLWAKTLVLSFKETTVVFISLDLIGFLFDEVAMIKKEISEKLQINELYLFIAATHNHSGPDTIGLWGKTGQESGKNPEYMTFLQEKILQCLEEAYKSRKPARFRFGKENLPELIYDARKPIIKNPLLLSMQAVDYQGNVIATMVNYAVHAEVLDQRNRFITADFPGFLRQKLEKHFGGIALFFPADIGGMQSPKVFFRSFSAAKRYGEKIAENVIYSLESENFKTIEKFNSKDVNVSQLLFPITNQRFLAAIEKGIFGATEKHTQKKDGQTYLPSQIAHMAFGPAEFLCIPGELFPEIGNEIREKMKGEYKFLLGLCNNEIGYIVPEEQWRDNGYEESMSLGKSTAKIILEEFSDLMK